MNPLKGYGTQLEIIRPVFPQQGGVSLRQDSFSKKFNVTLHESRLKDTPAPGQLTGGPALQVGPVGSENFETSLNRANLAFSDRRLAVLLAAVGLLLWWNLLLAYPTLETNGL